MKQTAEKQGFINQIISKITSIPYRIMDKYVHAQDNTDDFQTMYSFTWFIALAAMLVLIGICFWVDFQVLYGIEYNSTMDETHSYWSAFKSATIIQFLIVVCGGLFFKILIFNKLKQDEIEDFYFFKARISKRHLIQCCTFGILFLYGFAWTLDLAYKTYNSAKANALQNQISLDAKYNLNFHQLSNEHTDKLKAITTNSENTIKSIEQNYNAQIQAITNKWDALKAKKQSQFNNKQISKQTLLSTLANYEVAQEKQLAPLLKSKTEKINIASEASQAEIKKIKEHYQQLESNLDYQASRDRNDLNSEIENTAKETQGRNIKYNLISVVLLVGLLFFAKGCLEDKKKDNDTDTQDDDTWHGLDDDDYQNGNHSSGNTAKGNTKKNTVNTDNTQDDYLDYEDVNTTSNTASNTQHTQNTQDSAKDGKFSQDGYDFLRKFGKVYIKHGTSYADLTKLKVWYKTYSERVGEYTKEGKIDIAKKNAKMASIIAQKINYLKDHFVTDGYSKTTSNS